MQSAIFFFRKFSHSSTEVLIRFLIHDLIHCRFKRWNWPNSKTTRTYLARKYSLAQPGQKRESRAEWENIHLYKLWLGRGARSHNWGGEDAASPRWSLDTLHNFEGQAMQKSQTHHPRHMPRCPTNTEHQHTSTERQESERLTDNGKEAYSWATEGILYEFESCGQWWWWWWWTTNNGLNNEKCTRKKLFNLPSTNISIPLRLLILSDCFK